MLSVTLSRVQRMGRVRNRYLANKEVAKKIIKEITSNLMTPHWGCHLDLGVMVKLPVIPVGIYVDGKLMIPFDNMDKNVDLGGAGFLLNTGISLSF